jgi:hypothetical protein
MFYIHQNTCISPQQTFGTINLEQLNDVAGHKLKVVEGSYEGIPSGLLRRMGKAVRIGVGAGLPIIKQNISGIIIGTANGGMEDCIKFLNQIIDYKEGMLTPGNFVQSTNNAVAGQLGLMGANTGYNITHVHRALAFENAVIDAAMLLKENASNSYLLGAVDEISDYNYNIEFLEGGYKTESVSNKDLYHSLSAGSIAGEGTAMFLVNTNKENAIAKFEATHIFHTQDETTVITQLKYFLDKNLPSGEQVDLLLSGENGDNRFHHFYEAVEGQLQEGKTIARFKHMSGEYPTASSFAFWMACNLLQGGLEIPLHALKQGAVGKSIKRILIYNNYKGLQHSFILLAAC